MTAVPSESMRAASTKPVHVVVRYRDPSPDLPTVRLHQDVIDRCGAVWFGKLGKSLGEPWVRQIGTQVQQGSATFLYLVTRLGSDLDICRGEIEQLSYSAPRDALRIPAYYETLGLKKQVSFWALLGA